MTKIHTLIFAYERLPELQRTIVALEEVFSKSNVDLKLTVFCDYSDNPKAFEVQRFLKFIPPINGVTPEIILCQSKKGLRRNIMDGIASIADRYVASDEQPILLVLEDDIVLDPRGLDFIEVNQAYLENDARVFSLGLYVNTSELFQQLFSLGYPKKIRTRFDCWGWCTTPKKWKEFQDSNFLTKVKNSRIEVDLIPHLSDRSMARLRGIIEGRFDLWAAEINAYCAWAGRVQVKPQVSMAINVGQVKIGGGVYKFISTLINYKLHKILNAVARLSIDKKLKK